MTWPVRQVKFWNWILPHSSSYIIVLISNSSRNWFPKSFEENFILSLRFFFSSFIAPKRICALKSQFKSTVKYLWKRFKEIYLQQSNPNIGKFFSRIWCMFVLVVIVNTIYVIKFYRYYQFNFPMRNCCWNEFIC